MKQILIPIMTMVLLAYFPGCRQSNSELATLKLQILDQSTRKQIPARVLLKSADGKSYYPPDAVTLNIATEVWFMIPGYSQIDVPARKITLRIERGKEYERIKGELNLSAKQVRDTTIILRRWIDMKQRGYMSGENHLHRSPEDIAALCAAEDLDYGTVLQWWKGQRFEVEDSIDNAQNLYFGGISIPTTLYDMENENDWGALYVINLKKPFPFHDNPSMPNLFVAQYGRNQGAVICYQAGWSREVLIDALLGYVDIVNVCNNNFHMHRYQPRSFYSNLLDVPDLPVYPDSPVGMMQMNTDSYYRLLNCGLKIAAGAGSATGVKEVPVGYNRSYVHCSPQDGIEGFLQAWKEGKNFVTNGPMLFLRTRNGLQPGDSLLISREKKTITLNINAISDSPLQTVEIVINSQIVKSFPIDGIQKKFDGSVKVEIESSSWICARCTDRDLLLNDKELTLYEGPPVKLNQKPSRLRFAHTSPIYLQMNGNHVVVQKSIKEGRGIIRAFKEFAEQNAAKEYQKMILEATRQADCILSSLNAD